MSLQLVLLIGPVPDKIQALSEVLVEESIIDCQYLDQLPPTLDVIETVLPDLVLLFGDELEAAGDNVLDFCVQMRDQVWEHRPVLVVQTGANEEAKRIDFLIGGADDTVSTDLSVEELRIRLLVHLRRNLEILSNRVTRLPGLSLSSKILQRRIHLQAPWGVLFIRINHFAAYREVYGNIPSQQMLKTFSALLGSLILPPDFIGHLENDVFLVLTHAEQAEKAADILTRQFERVARNFYSERDQKRGYVISLADERISRRVGLLSLSIGVITHAAPGMDTYQAVLHRAGELCELAQQGGGSHWISERLRLTGSSSGSNLPRARSVLVVESDAALAFLLKTTLEMQQYRVETVGSPQEVMPLLIDHAFDMVLIDTFLEGEAASRDLCRHIKAENPALKILFVSTVHDRESALEAGADLYLPKPFELMSLLTWIDRLSRGG
jgi:DNA-binding response OmpR family regulator